MVLSRHERDKQIDKIQMYNTRLVCWMIYQANVDPKKAVKTIEDFMPLEEKKTVRKVSKAYLQKQAKLLEARLNKTNTSS